MKKNVHNENNVTNIEDTKVSHETEKETQKASPESSKEEINENSSPEVEIISETSPEEETVSSVPEKNIEATSINKEVASCTPEKKVESIGTKKVLFCINLSLIILLVIFLLLSTIFALIHVNSDKIISGISINGVNVSGLTKEEALNSIKNTVQTNFAQGITLTHGEYQTTLLPEQISATLDIPSAVEYAYQVGRSGGLLSNNYTILSTLFRPIDIEPMLHYNEEALQELIQDLSGKLPDTVIQPSYYIENHELIILKGKSGNVIDESALKSLLLAEIKNIDKSEKFVDIPVTFMNCDVLDLDKIHNEIYKEPKDAYYTTNPFVVYPHVDGIDFSISMEEAQALLTEDKEEYIIPLKIISPKVTTNQIGTEAFPDLLSSFSTKYVNNANRTTNLRLATNKVNGTVLLPGEVFSYNKVVGKRTIAAGYKNAAIFQNGKVVDGLGGGICQISSTLYDAVVYANLEIVERSNHGFVTSYLGAGRDATVVYGALDFQFKNSRKYPIKIVGSVANGMAEFRIYGKKEEVEYDVDIITKTIGSIPYKTRYVNDDTLPVGKTKILQGGSYGTKVEAYKVLKQNGNVISTTLLSRDTYNAMERVIAKGTKK